jgi:hypothetical protein
VCVCVCVKELKIVQGKNKASMVF